jgi:hypothetical protein
VLKCWLPLKVIFSVASPGVTASALTSVLHVCADHPLHRRLGTTG